MTGASIIGGRPAMITTSTPGSCAGIGGDETITATISRAVADNWYTMTACLLA